MASICPSYYTNLIQRHVLALAFYMFVKTIQMKNSRRRFLKVISFLGLGLHVLPLFGNRYNCKKTPIIIGIGKSGFAVMKLCNNNGVDAKNYILEQRHDSFSLPFHSLRAYINPDKNGKFNIYRFRGFILSWLKSTHVVFNHCSNPIIITNVIGDTYGTIAGRVMFDDLRDNNANVYWVLGFPNGDGGKKALQTASKYTHDISHLPNVVINNIEVDQNEYSRENMHLKANRNSNEILFLCIKNIIDKYQAWHGLS